MEDIYIFPVKPDFTHRTVRVYLETSALNFMHGISPELGGALATKAVHQAKGNIFYASPVLVWEILLIGEDDLRENLLNYCAHLCDAMMPKSPGELILDNILAGGEHVTYDDFSTASSFGKAWKNLSALPNQTLEFDKAELKEMSNALKRRARQLNSVIDDYVFDGTFTGEHDALRMLLSMVYSQIDYPTKNAPEGHIAARKLAILIMYLIVCAGAEIGGDAVGLYWKKLGIVNPFDRLMHLATRHPVSFYTGPVTFMAAVVAYQHSKGKTNRGALHDGLHAGYLPYFDVLLTNDRVLAEMQLQAKPIYYDQYSKMHLISEMEINLRSVRINKDHPLL